MKFVLALVLVLVLLASSCSTPTPLRTCHNGRGECFDYDPNGVRGPLGDADAMAACVAEGGLRVGSSASDPGCYAELMAAGEQIIGSCRLAEMVVVYDSTFAGFGGEPAARADCADRSGAFSP